MNRTVIYNPATHAIVPKEPTDNMRMACVHNIYQSEIDIDWSAMLAAAPDFESLPGTEQMLEELLARIHRDGGHHTDAVGLKQSAEDADLLIARLYADLPGDGSVRDAALEEARIVAIVACDENKPFAIPNRIDGLKSTPAQQPTTEADQYCVARGGDGMTCKDGCTCEKSEQPASVALTDILQRICDMQKEYYGKGSMTHLALILLADEARAKLAKGER